ncbi:hypothetical protein L7750_19120 [Xenorhabdus bovienii]|uniref:Uncharacterized protein n=1 Tax=Xenorhabdus bovienii str. feltiae Moldova TaxID=1398200 RepID=A0A077NNM7_XENBV|nr:hypothetical protein [Xenorhabdus bovienii]MCG3472402.1 hypothetical protein [Xenorhabdus bovienii]CDH00018.1 exported hypothetical protein [Xenorhabdus bovienii str. feltiae Moldova]
MRDKLKSLIPIVALFLFFISSITKASSVEDALRCNSSEQFTGYITGVAMGYYVGADDTNTRITIMFKKENEKNKTGTALMLRKDYGSDGGPGFLALAQTAMLTGQKININCNGSWVDGIWIGEGADASGVKKGLP